MAIIISLIDGITSSVSNSQYLKVCQIFILFNCTSLPIQVTFLSDRFFEFTAINKFV